MPSLFIDVEARFAQFQRSLDQIVSNTQRATSQIERSFGAVQSAIRALIPTITAASLVAWTKSVVDAQDELVKLSQKIGVSVEDLSVLRYAATLSDVSMTDLGTSLARLSKNMQDAAIGQGEAAKAFNALGISIRDASGNLRNTQDVLIDLADSFASIEDGAGKTALAMRIFGRSGHNIIPLLNQGREGLAQLRQELDALGGVMSEKTAKQMEAFNDNLSKLKTLLSALTVEFAGPKIGWLNRMIEQLLMGIKIAGGFWNAIIRFGAIDPFMSMAENLSQVRREIQEIESALSRMSQTGATDIMTQSFGRKTREQLEIMRETRRQQKEFLEFVQRQQAESLLGEGFVDKEIQRFGGLAQKRKAPVLIDEDELRRIREQRLKQEQEMREQWVKNELEFLDVLEEAWRHYYDSINKGQLQLLEEQKESARATEEMWRQIFETIDREQEDAIEAGRRLLEEQEEQARRTQEAIRDLGLTFASRFEDAIVQGGRLRDVIQGLGQDILRLVVRKSFTEPFLAKAGEFLGPLFAGIFHSGGVAGSAQSARKVSPLAFVGAPRLHSGGIIGRGEVPAILSKGEVVLTPSQARSLGGVTVNVINAAGASIRTEERDERGERIIDVIIEQIEGSLARNVARGVGLAPILERRYGLNAAVGALR